MAWMPRLYPWRAVVEEPRLCMRVQAARARRARWRLPPWRLRVVAAVRACGPLCQRGGSVNEEARSVCAAAAGVELGGETVAARPGCALAPASTWHMRARTDSRGAAEMCAQMSIADALEAPK